MPELQYQVDPLVYQQIRELKRKRKQAAEECQDMASGPPVDARPQPAAQTPPGIVAEAETLAGTEQLGLTPAESADIAATAAYTLLTAIHPAPGGAAVVAQPSAPAGPDKGVESRPQKGNASVKYIKADKQVAGRADASLRRAQGFLVFSFLGTLFFFGALSLLLPKPTVSEYEKRALAPMPEFSAHELFWGDYLREVEAHYADTFPLRDDFMKLSARLGELRGIRVDGVRLIDASPQQKSAPAREAPPSDQGPQPQRTPAAGALPAEQEEEEPTPFEMEDDGGQGEQTDSGLFIYQGRAMSIFGGSSEMGSRYAKTLNDFAARVGDGVRVYNIVVPTGIEFYLPERYQSVTNPQKPQIDHIRDELEGVIAVDAYTAIHKRAGEYLYFKTDHHWTGLGAYYAYAAYCESAGLKRVVLEDFEHRSLNNEFLGTFYSQSYDSMLRNSADRVNYYVIPGEFEVTRYDRGAPYTANPHSIWAEYASGANSYGVFLHGDYPLIHTKTGRKNGGKVIVIKESFGNAFAPFLLSHYEEVFIADQRYFELGLASFVEEQGIDDVIFINNAFAANTKTRIEDLERIIYR